MNKKNRLIILGVLFLFMAWLGSSIIRDTIVLITKNNLNNNWTNVIVFILTILLLSLMLKTIFSELGSWFDEIGKKFAKRGKTKK
jgi:hypothetical protein